MTTTTLESKIPGCLVVRGALSKALPSISNLGSEALAQKLFGFSRVPHDPNNYYATVSRAIEDQQHGLYIGFYAVLRVFPENPVCETNQGEILELAWFALLPEQTAALFRAKSRDEFLAEAIGRWALTDASAIAVAA